MSARTELVRWIRNSLRIPGQREPWEPPELVRTVHQLLESPTAFPKTNINNWRRNERDKGLSQMFPEDFLEGVALALAKTGIRPWEKAGGVPLSLIHDFYAYQLGIEFGEVRYRCRLSRAEDDSRFMNHVSHTEYLQPILSNIGPVSFHLRNRVETVSDIDSANCGFSDVEINTTCDGDIREVRHADRLIMTSEEGSTGPPSCAIESHREFLIGPNANDQSKIEIRRAANHSFALKNEVAPYRKVEIAGVPIQIPIRRLRITVELPIGLVSKPIDFPLQVLAWGPQSWQPEEVEYKLISENLISGTGNIKREGWSLTWESLQPPVFGMTYAIGYDIDEVENVIRAN